MSVQEVDQSGNTCEKPVVSLHWKCPKCKKTIIFKVDIGSSEAALDSLILSHQMNLCTSCTHNFPTCEGDPTFGECLGNDNVISCTGHVAK